MRADIEFGTFVINTTFCGGRARSETKGLYSQVNKLNNYDTKLRTFLIFFGLLLCRLSVKIDGLCRVYVRRAERRDGCFRMQARVFAVMGNHLDAGLFSSSKSNTVANTMIFSHRKTIA